MKLSSPRKTILSGAAVAAAAILATGLYAPQASAKSVLECSGPTRNSAVSCCDALVQKHGRPIWMRKLGSNCERAVVCKSGSASLAAAANKRCYYPPPNPNDNPLDHGPKSESKRGSN